MSLSSMGLRQLLLAVFVTVCGHMPLCKGTTTYIAFVPSVRTDANDVVRQKESTTHDFRRSRTSHVVRCVSGTSSADGRATRGVGPARTRMRDRFVLKSSKAEGTTFAFPDGETASRAGLRELRRLIDDEGGSTEGILKMLVDGVAGAEGQELLITEASVILQRCPPLAGAAEAGELGAALKSSNLPGGEYLLEGLEREIVAELHTPWPAAVKKWRQKSLAVEKYRSTNPTANAAVYTYMVNCCLRQGMWEVAYDALTYAGLMTAGPFFVSQRDVGLGTPSVVLDMDKMACYVAEKILDMDLDVWRRKGGDLDAGENTVGNDKPGVGIEERNFSQDESSVTHLAALRVQDMTLAAGRVALRKIRTVFQASDLSPDASLIVLCSATRNALYLRELLLPRRAVETLFALDFAEAVELDDESGQQLRMDSGAIADALGLLTSGDRSAPLFVVRGDALKAWAGQGDDPRADASER